MKTRHLRLSTGERMVLLAATLYSMPDLWVAAYVVTRIRSTGVSVNSARNQLVGIGRGLAFFSAKGVFDVRSRALQWRFTNSELAEFANACGSRVHGGPPIINAHAHYAAFIAFFVWLGTEPSACCTLSSAQRRLAQEQFERRAKLHKPRASPRGLKQERLGLTLDQRNLYMRAIVPISPDNPFGGEVAFRNFVLMTLAMLLGLRTGEVLGLKVQDFDFVQMTVTIHRRPDDPEDPRRLPAAQKTLPRTLPMSERLTVMCELLAKETRPHRAQNRHSYLFTNRYGQPLGQRGLSKVYEVFRRRHPSLEKLVHHVLRHNWNDMWNEMVKANKWDPVRSHDEQTLAMGWSTASRMPLDYSVRSRREAARLRILQMQNESFRGNT